MKAEEKLFYKTIRYSWRTVLYNRGCILKCFLLIIYSWGKNYLKFKQAKSIAIYYLTVSVGQEFGSG